MNRGFLSPLDLIMESLLDFMEERAGWFIDSIGVHVLEGTFSISRPIPRPTYESIDANEVQVYEVRIPRLQRHVF